MDKQDIKKSFYSIETEDDIKKISLKNHLFIESSAGTGKTFTLENLYSRLIKEENLSLKEILVVTFTEAAGKELKERIQEKLKEDKNLISNFHESQIFTIHGFSQRILRDYASFFEIPDNFSLLTQEKDLNNLKNEALHAFFRSHKEEIAREEMLLKGYESLLKISSNYNSFNDIKKFLFLLLSEKKIKSLKVFLEEKESQNLKELWNIRENEDLFSLIKKWKEELSLFLEKEEIRNSFDKRKIPKVLGAFELLKRCESPSHVWSLLDNLTIPNLSTSKEKENITFHPLHKLFHFCQNMENYETTKSLSKRLLEEKENLKSTSYALKEYLPSCLWEEPKEKIGISLLSLFLAWNFAYIALEKASYELDKIKKQKNLLTFDDLILKLSHGSLTLKNEQKKELKELYKAILIDEFQDTDNYQWNIFSNIFLSEKGTLSMIGDPKQAIYGFRGAEISSYYQAKEKMLTLKKTNLCSLPVCRRSEKDLINSLNLIFEEIFKEDLQLFQGDNFEKVLSYKENDPLLEDISPITILLEEENEEKDIRKTYQDFLIFLENFLNIKKILPRNCLILSRNRSELKELMEVAKQLRDEKKLSLSLLLQENEPLNQKEEYKKTTLFLSFLENPSYHFSQIMLSPFFDLNLHEITWLSQENQEILKQKISANLSEIYNNFFEKGNIWSLFDAIENLSQKTRKELVKENYSLSSLRKYQLEEINWEERFLIKEEQESLFYFRQVFSWLAKEIQGLKSFKEFLKDISTGKREIPITQNFPNETKIPLMTMHQSKGLESEFVFILASKEFPSKKWATPCYSFYEKGEIKEDFYYLEKNKGKALLKLWQEEKNLLYVSLTRAEKRVFLLSPSPKKNSLMSYFINILSLKPRDREELISLLSSKKCISLEMLAQEEKIPPFLGKIKLNNIKPILPKEIKEEKREKLISPETSFEFKEIFNKLPSFSSFSSLTSEKNSLQDSEITQNPQENLSSLPKGALVGSWIHLLLEKIPFSSAQNIPKEEWEKTPLSGKKETIEDLFQDSLKEYLPFVRDKEKIIKESIHMIFNILQSPFIKGNIKLSDIPKQKTIKEREFTLKVKLKESKKESLSNMGNWTIPLSSSLKNGFMKGILDCLIESQGKIYLLDWKTNFLGNESHDYQKDKLKTAMEENNYDLQYHIYSLALKIWFRKYQPQTPFEEVFGGVYYIFTRAFLKENQGEGIYFQKIPIETLNILEEFIFEGE